MKFLLRMNSFDFRCRIENGKGKLTLPGAGGVATQKCPTLTNLKLLHYPLLKDIRISVQSNVSFDFDFFVGPKVSDPLNIKS